MNIKNNAGAKKWIIIAVLSAVFLTGTALYSRRDNFRMKSYMGNIDKSPLVETVVVEAENIFSKIEQNTSIDAVNRVSITPRVTGRLLSLNKKRGEKVKKGEVLAVLEHEQQDAKIRASEAQVAAATAESEKAHAELVNAEADLLRYERLFKEGFSTQQQYDSVKTSHKSAKATYNAALAKERQVKADLVTAKSTKSDYIITSPMDGTVLEDYDLAPGAMISQNTPLLDVADLTMLKATLRIPESKLFAVKKGMPVHLSFNALPGREFTGTVAKTDLYVDPDTRTTKVEIVLDNRKYNMLLHPGMFGQSQIVTEEKKNVTVIPDAALFTSDTGSYVFAVENGKAVKIAVETGISETGRTEITKGIKPGAKIIVFGANNLKEGEEVRESGSVQK